MKANNSVPLKLILLQLAFSFFCFFLVVTIARNIRTPTGIYGAEAPDDSSTAQGYHFVIIKKEDEKFAEGDLVSMDYSPARKRPPIHN
ncbi:hypothetical protein Patl1_08001 [Pistacia atlantica]|uniref:Uncharacterized protein n=1 Tax=Pistacia atlantica TaxID=434234 RepID=A0ACC1AGB1_9ROSI|nr:hypothetical protein Patl1_08001 [Pistacia atlantica]